MRPPGRGVGARSSRHSTRGAARLPVAACAWRPRALRVADERRSDRILAAFAERCAHQDLPRRLAAYARASGLTVGDRRVVPQLNTSCGPDAFSRHLRGLIAAFVVGRQGLTSADAAAWIRDLEALDAAGDDFVCLHQYLFVLRRPL